MKPLPGFGVEVADHFQFAVNIFIGDDAWDEAVPHRFISGRGSVLVVDHTMDPFDLMYPVFDRRIKVYWNPPCTLCQIQRLARLLLLEENADWVASAFQGGVFFETHPDVELVRRETAA
jgi:hypothetical protein